MGKKSKKASQAEAANQAANNQIEEGNQAMGSASQEAENIPATIVEGSEMEVFAGDTETPIVQEVTTEVAPTQTPEVVVPAEKPVRISKRPYIARVCELLEAGTHDAKEITALVLVEFADTKKSGVQTFVTDLKNEKYRHWKDRAVVVNAAGKLQFVDKVVPVEVQEEVVTPAEEAQPEKPAE